MSATTARAFQPLPYTAGGHATLLLHAVVFRLVELLRRRAADRAETLDDMLRPYPFLADRFAETRRLMPEDINWGSARAWWDCLVVDWEACCNASLPLLALARDLRLGLNARLVFVATALFEVDPRFNLLFADLGPPLAGRRPTVHLLSELIGHDGTLGGGEEAWYACRSLLGAGLVEAVDRQAPRGEWALQVPSVLWEAAWGAVEEEPVPGWRINPPDSLPDLDGLIHPHAVVERLHALPAMIETGQVRTVVVRGDAGADGADVVGAVAKRLGRGLIAVARGALSEANRGRLGPLCTLTGSIPLLAYDLAPGETVEVPELAGYAGPVAILLGQEGGLSHRGHLLTLTLPMPDRNLRARHWHHALGGRSADVETFGERFHLAGGLIRQVGQMAVAEATLHGRELVWLEDVRAAQRAIGHQLLDSLADRLETTGSWQQLVSGQATRGRLRELELRCRHRERLLEHLGSAFDGNANRGVRGLFTGASGTGKTLAARLLAAELGMDLFRVDLAAVINKYIGETEKNLHRVLARAEALDVILLLDEGDALLGNRTEVRSANDRYANLETNYLLQRLETYQGIIIVTTNLGDNIDRAFKRRMDVVVPFFPPQADERRAILGLHLPANHEVDEDELDRIARRCALTGGQLRNAALQAGLLALDEGVPLGRWHLQEALRSEYRKAGGTFPLDTTSLAVVERDGGMAAFITALGER